MPLHDYIRYFPFSKIRPEQGKAIEYVLDAFESGKKYVVLELGTGVGKSATGICVARYMDAHGSSLRDQNGDTLTGT